MQQSKAEIAKQFAADYIEKQQAFQAKYQLGDYMDWLIGFLSRKALDGFDSESAEYRTIFDSTDSERDVEMANDIHWLFRKVRDLHTATGMAVAYDVEDEQRLLFRYRQMLFRICEVNVLHSFYLVNILTPEQMEPGTKSILDITPYAEDTLSKRVSAWTKNWFAENGRETAVLGISGGKDSAVVAGICEAALGADRVYGIMMPNGVQADIKDSETVVKSLGIHHGKCDIAPAYEAICNCVQEAIGVPISEAAAINVGPRVRMAILYAIAQTLSDTRGARACVAGTGNRGEAEVGYSTKGGDSVCDFNPIRDLWVDEVVQVGDELPLVPSQAVHKTPSDGLCGKSDEERLGVTYEDIKRVCTGDPDVPQEIVEKVKLLQGRSAHKRNPIPYFRKPREVRTSFGHV